MTTLPLPFPRPIPPALRFGISPLVIAIGTLLILALPSRGSAPADVPRLVASPEPGWPQFRGPRRDGVSHERQLLQAWPDAGPLALWTAPPVGRGFSSPVVVRDRVFITGDVDHELHIVALDLEGRPVWRATNGLAWRTPYPGARSSVTYSAGRLYHQNAQGRLACLDAATGREVWSLDVLRRFNGENITWGLSECLAVDERAVYVTAGGREALVAALDPATGDVLWQTPPLPSDRGDDAVESASYVSPILVEFGGRRLLIGCSLRQLYGVDTADGRLLWTRPYPTTYSVLAMMPVLAGDGFFMTAPHGRGGHFHRLEAPPTPDAPPGIADVWTTRLDTCQGGVVHHDGTLYGTFYSGRRGWAALDARTGAIRYELDGHVKGAALWADGRLYALCEDGWMLLLEPGSDRFEVRGRFRWAEAEARDAWAHPVIHQGRLYLRYHDRLTCFDIRQP